jgi:ubiquitin thioesterase protein OTUB1
MDDQGNNQMKPKGDMTEAEKENENEIMKQIEMNENAINDIKKAVADSKPFVSCKMDVNEYKEHWRDNKFYDSFISLLGKYSQARELRRDGNCFYRALLWQMFEYFLTNDSENAKAEYQVIVEKISKSKEDLLGLGYDEIVVEDFYEMFLEKFKNLNDPGIDTKDEAVVHKYLEEIFSNESIAPYMLMHCRFMTSAYLKGNAFLYEDFMVEHADVASYCNSEIEGVDREAEQIAIIGLTNYLGIAAEINQVQANGSVDTITIPEDAAGDNKRFVARLLFTPGHYDALYQ